MQLSFAFFVCKQYINIRAFVQHNIIYYGVFFFVHFEYRSIFYLQLSTSHW